MTQTIIPDEDDVRDFVQDYSDIKRLTPSRANDLLDKIMADTQPEEPDADCARGHCSRFRAPCPVSKPDALRDMNKQCANAQACCGSSCCPCVMDTWREEVAIWKAFRAGGAVDAEAMAKKFPK
ncbi:hypothetical protein A1Q2_01892 [Trichosporon asahii var. asahii CBS 8904]|uniref:Uncharacterized protein n=1 Tax=Trichosporon asahii var. asahii (strain CBS 8904) TaxID=1220162 RepID=K1WSB2_TRIAC|nr:hypothetical protein A1Q2_01892 [Trichosporon asahii var. asahii CBS 8904]